jgi:acyl-CoA hydrolase
MKRELSEYLAPGMRVMVSSMSNESTLLNQELLAHPQRARGVEFRAVQFPGIDRMDYISLHPEARQSGYFMSPGLRKGMLEQRAELYSLDYPGIVQHLQRGPAMDLAIAQVSEPDADGWCAPGMSCDFMPLAWARAKRRVAHINPLMPRLASSFRIHISELDGSVVSEQALLDFKDPPAGDVESSIGQWIAPLIRDGDTLQFGIGAVPLGLASALKNHRRLRFHGGLVSSALKTLWEAGALDRDARITTGVVLGDAHFREFMRHLPQLWLTDVSQTHNEHTLSEINGLIAINSAIEVDLLGQVNAERAGGKLQAGAGGLPVFARGALSAPNGRLLICLPSTARKGKVSRIVPALGHESICTLPRYLADAVVTEHGVAEIRYLSPDARAQALIAIASPEHRPELARAWTEIRQQL